MQPISKFNSRIKFLLTDIDDTITDEGLLGSEAYSAMWELHKKNIHVIPVTGRPAGWCEMIARVWPVSGIIGENGGFYFKYHDKKMSRYYVFNEKIRAENRKNLDKIEKEVLEKVPGTALASDQFCRLMDLAIDFCEDVPKLPRSEVQKIVSIFEAHGAQAKVSSIHVNGWFGKYDKLTTTQTFLKTEFGLSDQQIQEQCAFSGDSPNDEPMFKFFKNSFAVANISEFIDEIKAKPSYIAANRGGIGFTEIAEAILKNATF